MRNFVCKMLCLVAAFSACHAPVSNKNAAAPPPQNSLPAPESVANIQSPEAAPEPLTLVKAYNERNLGSPGWRRITLDLHYRDGATTTYTALNLWAGPAGEMRTLVLMVGPENLRGMGYLLEERDDAKIALNLFVPTSETELLVSPGDDDEQSLLKTDFTFFDLRARLPTQDVSYRLLGASTLNGQSVWVIQAERAKKDAKWPVTRFYLARQMPLLLGADYFTKNGETTPNKQFRVIDYRQQEGVWTPTRMTMHGPFHASAITLNEAAFKSTGFPAEKLTAKELPAWAERLKQGWLPKSGE